MRTWPTYFCCWLAGWLSGCFKGVEPNTFAVFCAKLWGLEPEVVAGERVLKLGVAQALGLCNRKSAMLECARCFKLEAQIDLGSHAILGTPDTGKTIFMAFGL